jgi:FixJ family two-component response regulator
VESLTDRQRQVLEALIKHGESKRVARELGITSRAVEEHMSRIREKLGTHTIGACVALAIEKERSKA